MKIRLTLPNKESQYLGHDSPLIRAIGFGILAFLLISSLTVFAGVRSHISGYLEGLPSYLAWAGYGIGYTIFSLAPDSLNVICIAFVARSILKGYCKDVRSIVLITVCLATSYYLTDYSYHMSQISAEALARGITPETKGPAVEKVDSTLQNIVQDIGVDFDKQYNRLSAEYDTLIANSNRSYEAKKAPFYRQITKYERNRKTSNTEWTDRQIDRQKRKIEPLDEEKLVEATRLTTEKRKALDELRSRRVTKEDRAQLAADTTKAIVITTAIQKNSHIEAVTNILIKQLSGIAGKSVFILLALAGIREILRQRNAIEPVPVFSEFDFGGNPIVEAILFVPTFFGRWVLRNVRTGYEGIRTKGMPSPERPGILYDWTTANNEVGTFEQPETDEDESVLKEIMTSAPPTKSPRQKRKRSTAKMTKQKSRPIGFNFPVSENKSPANSTAKSDQTKAKSDEDKDSRYNGPVIKDETKGNSTTKTEVIFKEIDTSLKECLHCGTTFKPRAHNQKFCRSRGPGNCKDAHHTAKHGGQAFDPSKFHGRKRK